MKHTDLCYFHLQLTWLDWSRSRSRSRSFWSRSHNRFLVSVSVSISVSHSLFSVLALVSLTSLVMRWVTVSGFNSRCGTFISVCNQPPRPIHSSWPSLRGQAQWVPGKRAGTPCGWGVKAGVVRVWVAGKTVLSHCYTPAIAERSRDKRLTYEALYKCICLRYFNSFIVRLPKWNRLNSWFKKNMPKVMGWLAAVIFWAHFQFCLLFRTKDNTIRNWEKQSQEIYTLKHGTHMHARLFHATFDWWCWPAHTEDPREAFLRGTMGHAIMEHSVKRPPCARDSAHLLPYHAPTWPIHRRSNTQGVLFIPSLQAWKTVWYNNTEVLFIAARSWMMQWMI